NKLTALGLGKDMAKSLGLNYNLFVLIGLTCVSLTVSAIMITAGAIPFLGLIVPNIVSLFYGDNLKKSLPYTAILGAILILFCDIISRIIIYPFEVPIGLTIAIIGGISFIIFISNASVMLKKRILLLVAIAFGVVFIYMFTLLGSSPEYVLPRRATKLAAMLLISCSIGYSSVVFQTITENRILTPSIMGFESVYILFQALNIFIYNGSEVHPLESHTNF